MAEENQQEVSWRKSPGSDLGGLIQQPPRGPVPRSRPPIWLMGMGNLAVGVGGAVALVTAPQLLAARGVAESSIANVTSVMLVSQFTSFLFAPILDWKFSRRTYAVALALVSALLCFATLLCIGNLIVFSVLLLCLGWAFSLIGAALGGWFSELTSEEERAPLGAWLMVANLVGVGLTSAIAILFLRHSPPIIGPALVALLFLAPVPIYFAVPATAPDAKLAHETFSQFGRDVLSLLRKPVVKWLMFFLVMPAGSFALSNTLPGFGRDYGASDAFVGAVCGLGVAVAGILGSLVIPPLARRLPSEPLYLAVAACGALFTLAFIAAPHTPTTYAIVTIGENAFFAASFSVVTILVLRSNGAHNPLGATQCALLGAASGVPLTYMQLIDGHAYSLGRASGSYAADAVFSLAACALLGLVLFLRRRSPPLTPAVAATE